MNSNEFRKQWSEWHAGRLDPGISARMAQHREQCEACRRYDRQMRRMLDRLQHLPLPDEMPAEQPAAAPARRWRPAPATWLAAAAALVLAFGAGMLTQTTMNGTPAGKGGPVIAEAVQVVAGTTRNVRVAFDSPRGFDSVEFVVELPHGVELEGFPGQRIVRWEGRLAEGRSRLTLPLRIGDALDGDDIVTRIRYEAGERELRIPLAVTEHNDTA